MSKSLVTYNKEYLDASIQLMASLQSEELNLNDLCRILSLTTLKNSPGAVVFIFKLNSDATFSLVSGFGISDEFRTERQNISLTSQVPASYVIKNNESIGLLSPREVIDSFPDLEDIKNKLETKSTYAIPIRKFGLPIGSITIMGDNLPDTENFKIFLELLGLMIASRFSVSGEFIELLSREIRIGKSKIPLTNREILIQKNMKKGLTNAQIAMELGYSESTIRQAAVTLFTKLGVSNRIDAGDLLPDELVKE